MCHKANQGYIERILLTQVSFLTNFGSLISKMTLLEPKTRILHQELSKTPVFDCFTHLMVTLLIKCGNLRPAWSVYDAIQLWCMFRDHICYVCTIQSTCSSYKRLFGHLICTSLHELGVRYPPCPGMRYIWKDLPNELNKIALPNPCLEIWHQKECSDHPSNVHYEL